MFGIHIAYYVQRSWKFYLLVEAILVEIGSNGSSIYALVKDLECLMLGGVVLPAGPAQANHLRYATLYSSGYKKKDSNTSCRITFLCFTPTEIYVSEY